MGMAKMILIKKVSLMMAQLPFSHRQEMIRKILYHKKRMKNHDRKLLLPMMTKMILMKKVSLVMSLLHIKDLAKTIVKKLMVRRTARKKAKKKTRKKARKKGENIRIRIEK